MGPHRFAAAIGEDADLAALPKKIGAENNLIPTDERGATRQEGVFAGGDNIRQPHTVVHAIGSGKRAALAIDHYLRTGQVAELPPLAEAVHAIERAASKVVVRVEDLNLDYLDVLPRPLLVQRAPEVRKLDMAEVNLGLDAEAAAREAGRCISCGTCTACDTCLVFCPDVAITRVTRGRYAIAYDYCKGCGICAEECPRAAMSMQEEGQ